jgi:tetratricopeptide (TPR) repeat protein
MKEKHAKIFKRRVVLLLGVAVPFAASFAQGASEEERAFAEEVRYIEHLQQHMRMPDIAEEVIASARKVFQALPEAAPRLKVCEIQGQLSQGRFDDVQKVIDAIADKNGAEFWALTLAKADAYYMFGKYPDADKLYLSFFKKVDKPAGALVPFYRDSAYKYVQMLLYLGKDKEALVAFGNLIDSAGKAKVPLEEDVERQIRADKAELMLKLLPDVQKKEDKDKMLKEAEATVDKLLWKQDVWFGKAIVMKAHLCLLRGDIKGAKELVENYMPQLKIIHDSLKKQDPDGSLGMLRMSPMPQCRYMLALLLQKEVEAEIKKEKPDEERIKDLLLGEKDAAGKRKQDGAFNHFINVFIRFPESQWASEAGERSEILRKLVKTRYNYEIRTPVTEEMMRKVREMQFAGARLVFSQNQFKAAIAKYLLVLNPFPESPESVPALGDLAISYIETSDKDADAALMADTVVAHLAERFSANAKLMKEAGDQLRRIGEHYGELRMEDKKRQTYALFFRDYPAHYAAGQLVMSFGEREFAAKNYVGAIAYYKQVAEIYTNSPYYFDAINRMAQVYKEEGQPTNEIQTLEFYVEKLSARERPGHALIIGKFRLADAYRDYGLSFTRNAGTNEAVTAEQKAETQKTGAVWLAKAARGFGDVAKTLDESAAAYQQNDEEKQRNAQMREAAVFTRAVCLTQVAYPEDKLPMLRQMAITAYEDYVKRFPKGRFAPRAQLQLGTLYTILQDTANAQAAFEKLSKAYPESEEAKNSVPMQAAALIDIGLRGEGVAKYRQMFGAGGTYTESQFMAAAKALEDAREYDMALQAYDKVLATAKDIGQTANAKLGRARCSAGQKKFGEAHKVLEAFVKDKDLSKLMLVVDANLLLVEVASEEGKTEKNDNERTRLFNAAVDALKMVRKYHTNTVEQAELDLKTGEVQLRKMEAEKKLGLTAQAAETRGKTIVAFQVIIMHIDPGNAALAATLEKAYFYCLPLLLEHKKFKDAEEDCERYLSLFPNGRYRTDVQNWLNEAKIGQ